MNDSKKDTEKKSDKRRDNVRPTGVIKQGRTTGRGRSAPQTVATRSGNRKNGSSGVREEHTSSFGLKERPVAEPGISENVRSSVGRYFSPRYPNSPGERRKVSRKVKERILMILDAIVLLGVIGSVGLTLVLLGRLNEQAAKTHEDSVKATATVEADLRCLGTFFSLPDRQNLKIIDLHECKIVNTETGKTQIVNNTNFDIPADTVSRFIETSPYDTIPPENAGNTPIASSPSQTPSNTSSTPNNSPPPPSSTPQPNVLQRIINFVPDTINKIL